MYKIENDGIDHINIYSKGKTELGRWLSNFERVDIITDDGLFKSIESYYFWLLTRHDKFKTVWGAEAKMLSKNVKRIYSLDNEIKNKILIAIDFKLNSNMEMFESLKKNELKLVHYYVSNGKISLQSNMDWIISHLNSYKNRDNGNEFDMSFFNI